MNPKKPTPIKHGAWRVINGQLVNEDELPALDAAQAQPADVPTADAVVEPPADPVDPASDTPPPITGRKTKSKE